MIKLSRTEAYQYMDQVDFDLMDDVQARIAAEGASENKELSSQFCVGADKGLYLEFYLDGEQVERVHFLTRKIKLTADGERRLAEAIERENVEMELKETNDLKKGIVMYLEPYETLLEVDTEVLDRELVRLSFAESSFAFDAKKTYKTEFVLYESDLQLMKLLIDKTLEGMK